MTERTTEVEDFFRKMGMSEEELQAAQGSVKYQPQDVANSERIAELEKRIEKLEQLTESMVLYQFLRRRDDSFFPNDAERKILSHQDNKELEILKKVGKLGEPNVSD